METPAQKSPPLWIPALCFVSALLVFLMVAFYTTPTFTDDQRALVMLMYPLLAGFSALFLGGTVLFEVAGEWSSGIKFSISATAGIAVFLICYLYPPAFVSQFAGYQVKGTVDLLFPERTIVEESNPTIRSDTVRTGQNGDTKGTRLDFELPAGAFEVKHKAWWNADCIKTSESHVEGNHVIAEGTITAPKFFGPRVWGELLLDVSWKRERISSRSQLNTPLTPFSVSKAPGQCTFAFGNPVRISLQIFDARNVRVDTVIIARPPDRIEAVIQTSERGMFLASLSNSLLLVRRNL